MAASYRFGDSAPTGVLLGLRVRQVLPLTVGLLWLPVAVQLGLPAPAAAAGVVAGVVVAFGRWRGAPLADVAVPTMRLRVARTRGRSRWVAHPLVGGPVRQLPGELAGLELLEPPDTPMAVIRDRRAGTVSAVVRVHGAGFALAGDDDQDARVVAWAAALSPAAQERCQVRRITWQEWTHPVGVDDHLAYARAQGLDDRSGPAADDYRALLDRQAAFTVSHELLVAVTVDQRLVRRRAATGPVDAAVEALNDEVRQLTARLENSGLRVEPPLTPAQWTAALRVRCDPGRSAQVATLQRSLAAASGRGALDWGPMAVEPSWGSVHVDGSFHRSYWLAGWPALPVPADWMGPLLLADEVTRTVTVVLEPIPLGRAARAADRQVMQLEADQDMKQRKGFRINAAERKRLAHVEARERELSEGHAQFRFAGLVTVTAPTPAALDDAAATVEQAAAQSLLDLRALEARHAAGWAASLPTGRSLRSRGGR